MTYIDLYNNVDLSDMGNFHDFVTSYTHEELLETIDKHYLKIKNKCKYAPCLGYNGCLEFAASLLFHLYIIYDLQDYEYGCSDNSEEILLHGLFKASLTIGSAFMGCTPSDFSGMTDMFSTNTTITTRKEFSTVYLYLQAFFSEEIRTMEFNEGNNRSHREVYAEFDYILKNCNGNWDMIRNYLLSQGIFI